MKAATDLQSISELLRNNPRTKVENIQVVDSGEYATVVVRVHVSEAEMITLLPVRAVAALKTEAIVAGRVAGTAYAPPLPPPVREPDMVIALPVQPVVAVSVADNAPATAISILSVPTLPPPVAEDTAVSPLPMRHVANIATAEIAAGNVAYDVSVPPLPPPVAEDIDIDAVPPRDIVAINIGGLVAGNLVCNVTVPHLPPPVEEDAIMDLPVQSLKLMVIDVAAGKMDTVALISFEENRMPVTELHLSDEGYSLLEKLEGFSPELYSLQDGGFTIGFGFFVPYGEGNKWNSGVTWEQAERLIRQKMPQYEDQVKRYINVPLTQYEFDALTMLAYNLGGFSKATSIVNDVNNQAGFDKLKSDWTRFVHSKAPGVTRGLMNRRKDELGVKKYANYQPERKIQILTRK